MPGKLRALSSRFHQELADAAVESWNLRSLYWEAVLRKQKPDCYTGFTEVGRRFSERVRGALKCRSESSPDSIFLAYDTGALEAMEWCRERGIKCVLNQMDPNRVEVTLVHEEEKRWPGWAVREVQVPEEYFRRREQEWTLADRVVVNSEFSRQALLQQGVPASKLVVVPLCYEPELRGGEGQTGCRETDIQFPISREMGPLRVLFLGQVILRKGIQYLIQAARSLEKENIQFDIVGPLGISQQAIASAPRNMVFHGRAGRDQASRWYQQADVFVLPTLSDGFAITQLEAMAYGLPVITTPCCGAVVTDGLDGFIIPACAPEALVQTFQRYLSEPGLLRDQQTAARIKAKQFTLDRLGANLLLLETSLLNQ